MRKLIFFEYHIIAFFLPITHIQTDFSRFKCTPAQTEQWNFTLSTYYLSLPKDIIFVAMFSRVDVGLYCFQGDK